MSHYPGQPHRRYPGTDGARALVWSETVRTMEEPWRRAVIIAQCSDEMLRELAISAFHRGDGDLIAACGAEVVWRRIQAAHRD